MRKASSIGPVVETLVSEDPDNAEQTDGASIIPEPWDDITGNKVSPTAKKKVCCFQNSTGMSHGCNIYIHLLLQAQLTSITSEVSSYVQVSTQDQDKLASECGEAQPKALLSIKQLVLRRGLTLLTTILILIAGIAVHVACPLPEHVVQHQSNFTIDSGNFSTLFSVLNITMS